MRCIRFLWQGEVCTGLVSQDGHFVLPLYQAASVENISWPIKEWSEFLNMRSAYEGNLKLLAQRYQAGAYEEFQIPLAAVRILAPLQPKTLRDGYAFRQHVETARKNRGLPMIPEFDAFPVFYFSNPLAVVGPGPVYCQKRHLEKLDYELEVAAVIGKSGKNLQATQADEYIFGFMLMNDWSARSLQMEEMKLNLGPAKGKDFATSLGPWITTLDELEPHRTEPPSGHIGATYRLELKAFVGDELLSHGYFSDMSWTFAEILERVSYGVMLYPGEVIGSGTVGTGCLLELNGTARATNPQAPERWLTPGDVVRLEGTALGELENIIHLAHESS